ncbi:MAG: YfcE family phosphodiesterase [Anaerolineaceae bacterium]|nr:YfcE family phosphodiesterase [Anaerolineaceae bacterium]
MRIAIISDIHGNLPAFMAVMEAIKQLNIDTIWNLGDSVGYGPYPEEVLSYLQEKPILSILGNYDKKVLKFDQKKKKWKKTKSEKKFSAFKWASKNISNSNKEFLASLPEQLQFELSGKKIRLVHGTPNSSQEPLYPHTKEERFIKLSEQTPADMILCGHSHQGFYKQINQTWFLNPGSVGRPDDGDYRASYMTIDLSQSDLSVQIHRSPYDLEKLVNHFYQKNLPKEFAAMFIQGCSLDIIQSNNRFSAFNPEIPEFDFPLSASQKEIFSEILFLCETCNYDQAQAFQIMKTALVLFDYLWTIYPFNSQARFYLQTAAILQDIGWIKEGRGHHKTTLRMVLDTTLLNIDNKQRLLIGSIARYHHGALPSDKHDHFTVLHYEEKEMVKSLVAIIRTATELNKISPQVITSLNCKINNTKVSIKCNLSLKNYLHEFELSTFELFQKTFNRKLDII